MTDASQAEKNVFGSEAQIHPITKMALETGRGSLSADQQAVLHLQAIEEVVADKMRKQMGISTRADREAAVKAKAAEEEKKAADVSQLHARIAELEAQVAELTKAKE